MRDDANACLRRGPHTHEALECFVGGRGGGRDDA
jgi:hypothetical protein